MKAFQLISSFLLVFLGFCSACRQGNDAGINGRTQQEVIRRMERDVHLNIPDDATLLHFESPRSFIDPTWIAKVRIEPQSFETVKEEIVRMRDDKTKVRNSLSEGASWWTPTNKILEKAFLSDRHTYVNVIAAKEEDQIAVYIECIVF